jgi:hypothetical protein
VGLVFAINTLPVKLALAPLKSVLGYITFAGTSPTEKPPTEFKGFSAMIIPYLCIYLKVYSYFVIKILYVVEAALLGSTYKRAAGLTIMFPGS